MEVWYAEIVNNCIFVRMVFRSRLDSFQNNLLDISYHGVNNFFSAEHLSMIVSMENIPASQTFWIDIAKVWKWSDSS